MPTTESDDADELRQLRDLRSRLIEALPKCDFCALRGKRRLATRVMDDWGKRYFCDGCRDIHEPCTQILGLADFIRSLGEID